MFNKEGGPSRGSEKPGRKESTPNQLYRKRQDQKLEVAKTWRPDQRLIYKGRKVRLVELWTDGLTASTAQLAFVEFANGDSSAVPLLDLD